MAGNYILVMRKYVVSLTLYSDASMDNIHSGCHSDSGHELYTPTTRFFLLPYVALCLVLLRLPQTRPECIWIHLKILHETIGDSPSLYALNTFDFWLERVITSLCLQKPVLKSALHRVRHP